ncbi:hypothetical protein PTTG_00710 [Puccinia triticina 1-1 BBBD Race 1]|uniref:F-box domain-containing protein n=1 Tax=Puccinia triticina (isolate 1-1 / race 1 (BBBD)) TaxID=630390 RepID=A0A180GC67_PUCT1|nr:hypothetical protein PTTG_00710 [Puccinia triticina 1-1 BBBD Race 1]
MQFSFSQLPSSPATSRTSQPRTSKRNKPRQKNSSSNNNNNNNKIKLTADQTDQQTNPSSKNGEGRLPDHLLELILNHLPDRFGFSSQPDEAQGTHWPSPPTSFRLINRRWARIGAEVFFKHLSIHTINRLEALAKLFNSPNQCLPRLVRTIVISINQQDLIRSTNQHHHQLIRELLSKLLKPLTALRSLSIRGCSPGILFPAPLELQEIFLPQSITRFAIQFRSQEDSALLSTLPTTPHTPQPASSSTARPTPRRAQQAAATLIELHAAELNLLLVCLPNLRSLHLSNFRSQPHRPLSRYSPNPEPDCYPQQKCSQPWRSIRALSLTDCELSDGDAHFFAKRFTALEALSISNSFIDQHHISAINHLLSPSPSPSPKEPDMHTHRKDGPRRLADTLERLDVAWTDFKYDPSLLLFPTGADSKPTAAASVPGATLAAQYAELDLSGLSRLRVLRLQTPTRALLLPDEVSTVEPSGPLASLESLLIDPRLLFFSSPAHLACALQNAPSLKNLGLLNTPIGFSRAKNSPDDALLGSVLFKLASPSSDPAPASSKLPFPLNNAQILLPLWYRKLSFQFFAWNSGFNWISSEHPAFDLL